MEACPLGLPVPGRIGGAESLELCLVCGACAEICPTQARQVAGRSMETSEVMTEIRKDRVFFEESGGGVTFSGGEPLGQPGFLVELLQECRLQGIHSAVDTCGLASWQDLRSAADCTDLFLFDLKHLDDRTHRRFTGVSNAPILENLRRLAGLHPRIWLRVPVIPAINDSAEHLRRIGELASRLPGVERVCLLPYHPLGEDKLRRMGLVSALIGAERTSRARLEDLVGLVEATGVPTGLGG